MSWQTFIFIILTAVLAGVAGCSSVDSVKVDPQKDSSIPSGSWHSLAWTPNDYHGDSAGLAYFLPMGKVHILALRQDILVTNYGYLPFQYGSNADFKLTNMLTAVRLITNTDTEITCITNYATNFFLPTLTSSNYTVVSNSFVGPNGTNSVIYLQGKDGTNTFQVTLQTNGIINTTTFSTQLGTITNQTAQITATNIHYSIKSTNTIIVEQPLITTSSVYQVAISVSYQADRKNLFLLQPQRDWFHDDSANFTIDNNGLLSSVNTSNSDQTGSILVQLAQAAVQSFEMVASGGASSALKPPSPQSAESQTNEYDIKTSDVNVDPTALAAKLVDTNKNQKIVQFFQTIDTTSLEITSKTEKTNSFNWKALNSALADVSDALNSVMANPNLGIGSVTNLVPVREATKEVYLSSQIPLYDASQKSRLAKLLKRMLTEDLLEAIYPGALKHVDWEKALATISASSPPPPAMPQKIDICFDPFDPDQLVNAKSTLANGRLYLENEGDFAEANNRFYQNWQSTAPGKTSGIFYRPPIPYEVRLRDSASNVVSSTVLLPNKSPILHLEMNKAPFVSAISQVTLTNGFVSSYAFSKPSTLNAMAAVPLVILNGITSSMTNLIQFKINLATGQNNLQNTSNSGQSNQNAAYLAQQTALLMSISNNIAIVSANQTLKNLTNTAAPTTAH